MPDIEIGPESQPLNDDSPMPFGKYIDKPIGRIPSEYLDWLVDQPWLPKKYPEVYEYIVRNLERIHKDIPDDDD